MSIGVLHGQNGGSGLAVKVVGGTVKPGNPKEGTIWVNTDQEISAWSMRSTEPGSPVEGMVWLTINAETAVNALKKNEINIKPLRANQYTGGAWVLKPAELYRGGAWSALKTTPDFTYTGEYELVNDADERIADAADGNWKIRFLTSGTLRFQVLNGAENGIDVFLVGGGGSTTESNPEDGAVDIRGGGGGGYTTTKKGVPVNTETPYNIVVGTGASDATGAGGTSTAFGQSAAGGSGTITNRYGGCAGGSGGGGRANVNTTNYTTVGQGGSDGGDGYPSSDIENGGKGQGTTTREFGEAYGKIYAGGGGGSTYSQWTSATLPGGLGGDGGGGRGGNTSCAPTPGEPNTGGGGGGGMGTCAAGGSGIVVIRNKR